MKSPYFNKPKQEWLEITSKLVDNHPITNKLCDMCFKTWESILNGKINSYLNLTIKDMTLSPQAVSILFHDILPEYIERQLVGWKKGTEVNEKDVTNISNEQYSFEIKISSSKNSIFGNRSYGQITNNSKKSKDGYYLAINIDKLSVDNPQVKIIKFGWIDHNDWISQKASTGQQARLNKEVINLKFKTLYNYNNL